MSKSWTPTLGWMTPALGWMLLLTLPVLLIPAAALAGEPRTHDGFFLRLSGGLGSGSTSIEAGGEDLKLSGLSGDVNLAIGGVIGRNLALHGTLLGWSVTDPNAKLNGFNAGSLNGDVMVSVFAGGITYYFMPSNVYISPSVGIATLSFDGDVSGDSDAGFALDITLGKEWWVGNSWGLGLAGAFGYHSIPDGGVDASWSGPSFGLRFSATMN